MAYVSGFIIIAEPMLFAPTYFDAYVNFEDCIDFLNFVEEVRDSVWQDYELLIFNIYIINN